ncbi:hypothetical protein TCA2_4775 [Paenibacillus sp. TCA20]|nr:hypothetical protein TCA2_4775 [Paenibacillus sp. TCA20]
MGHGVLGPVIKSTYISLYYCSIVMNPYVKVKHFLKEINMRGKLIPENRQKKNLQKRFVGSKYILKKGVMLLL